AGNDEQPAEIKAASAPTATRVTATELPNGLRNPTRPNTAAYFSHRKPSGHRLGGTLVTSPCVDKLTMICHKNGKAITKPPRISAACTNTCGCLWKKPSCTRRVCLRPDLLRSVGTWGADRSAIVHPPA